MGIKKNNNSDNQTKRSYHLITKRSHKQEMLHILTIPVRKIMHAYIRNSKSQSNIDITQNYLSKKEQI